LIVLAGRQSHVPTLTGRARAPRPRRAGGAVRGREPSRHVGLAVGVRVLQPSVALAPLRATDPPTLPVDLEAIDPIRTRDAALPVRDRPRRAHQLDAAITPPAD